jgi:hypothetical protein
MQCNFMVNTLTDRLIGGKHRREICFPHHIGITLLLRGAMFPVPFAIAHQLIPRGASDRLTLAPSVTFQKNYM